MSELANQIAEAFAGTRQNKSVHAVTTDSVQLGPAFLDMREYWCEVLLVQLRRVYRHFAGANLSHDADELLSLTSEKMIPRLMQIEFGVFTDGVLIGQNADVQVRMARHFNNVDQLFTMPVFRSTSATMATGFAGDDDVVEIFNELATQSLDLVAHGADFAHHEVDPNTIWDVWMLVGQATIPTAYIAGLALGQSWATKDTLDGIIIATEGDRSGPEAEAEPDR